MIEDQTVASFRQRLLDWAKHHPRPLPWKNTRDPYRIWLSEVMLQQTRVEQGLPYYEKFVAAYPTVTDLAAAPDEAVFKLWEGLGYYSRARNMLAAARYVADQLNGRFPDNYDDIRMLKGVGDYTAAAIASFAYNLAHAVVDGNVYRVLSRIFGIDTPIDTPAAKKQFAELASQLLDHTRPGAFNQAMMDFGATHCTPRLPRCNNCPFQVDCVAFLTDAVSEFPQKAKKMVKKGRVFIYLDVQWRGKRYFGRRQEKDIWQDLYTPPVLLDLTDTNTQSIDADALAEQAFEQTVPADFRVFRTFTQVHRQVLTHRVVTGIFIPLVLPDSWPEERLTTLPLTEGDWYAADKVAVPRLVAQYLGQ